MEFAILALAAVAVAIFLPIFLLFRTHKMKAQIDALERRVQNSTGGTTALEEPEAPVVEVEEDEKPEATPHQPWQPPKETAKPAARSEAAKKSPKSFVFKPEFRENIVNWFQKNWFFAVAAVSLALAGVFLVQYGVENGLLSPTLRVISAIVLGLILIAAGEYVRRKLGDDEGGSFALLPSAFSGAGGSYNIAGRVHHLDGGGACAARCRLPSGGDRAWHIWHRSWYARRRSTSLVSKCAAPRIGFCLSSVGDFGVWHLGHKFSVRMA